MFFLDFLFPRRCLNCGQWGNYFCSRCLNFLSLNHDRICPICGKNSIGGRTHSGCLRTRGLNGLTACFIYRGLVRKAIKKLKYKFVSDLAKDLVELFLSFAGEDKHFVQFCRQKPDVVPVPLHPRRKRWRGFNQSELLGKMIADNLGLRFLPDILARTRYTRPQTRLDRKERQKNIKGAFEIAVNTLMPRNPNILLFDDVWTSGATMREAGKILKKNKTEKVWGLTLAR